MPDRLLDSNAISAAMQGDNALEVYLRTVVSGERIHTTVVVEGEMRFGIARLAESERKKRLTTSLDIVLKALGSILPVGRSTSVQYGLLKAEMFRQGQPMGDNDLWIAATALEHGLVVVTRDTHFQLVPGLDVGVW